MLGRAIAAGLVPANVLANLFKSIQKASASSAKTFPLPKVDGDNTIALTVGDICDLTWSTRGQRPVYPEGPYGNRPVYSTGTLELALSVNLDVWVVTTKSRLDRWDAWWAECLPKDRIILAHVEESMSIHEIILRPWIDFAFRLGAAWYFMDYQQGWTPGEFAKAIYEGMLAEFRHAEDLIAWLFYEHHVSFARNLAEEIGSIIAQRHLPLPQ
ncbi:hypothetical protein KJZ71_01570 [Patescibacteria group bacterium]|nr:hypothetical protein [Patescibacteria group bacterium]MDL1952618.1 hypothetical protein [Candidatus Uhrbacteria bacterium UHB]RIL01250.1 MAG: hypothetical protein DCC77_01785 [Candidatus Uhrbacteria bacterium]